MQQCISLSRGRENVLVEKEIKKEKIVEITKPQTERKPTESGEKWREELKTGDEIEAMDTTAVWMKATVTKAKGSLLHLHFNGYSQKWDEWVSRASSRLRPGNLNQGGDSRKSVEAICLLDLSMESIWWPLFEKKLDKRCDETKLPGLALIHEYRFRPLVPLASLLFDKKNRVELFDAIVRCSTQDKRKLPDITFDTAAAISKNTGSSGGLFGQVKKQFKRISYRQLRGKLGEYSWATRWKGGRNVGSEGLPGPFQQSMGMIWSELSGRAQRRDSFSPVILCPNGELEIGDKNRDNLLLNPGLKSQSSFRCLGQLLGCILRSSSNCSLSFSRIIWKTLLHGQRRIMFHQSFQTKISELEQFDKSQGRQLMRIVTQSFDDFQASGYTYTTSVSDGCIIELFPGGYYRKVEYEDRLFYVDLVLTARLEENVSQMDMVRQGLLSVIPRYVQPQLQNELSPISHLMTWQELELRVCGSPDIDLKLLKANTSCKGVDPDAQVVTWFWKVLESLSQKDRQRFIQFAWARSRLPHDMGTNANLKMHLNFTSGSELALPKAQTCFFLVDMPVYKSEEILREKLMMALNCDEINS